MVSCVPGAMVAIARKCKPLEPSEAVWRTTTQLASPGGALFFTSSRPTLPDGRISDGWGLTPRGAHTWGYPRTLGVPPNTLGVNPQGLKYYL